MYFTSTGIIFIIIMAALKGKEGGGMQGESFKCYQGKIGGGYFILG